MQTLSCRNKKRGWSPTDAGRHPRILCRPTLAGNTRSWSCERQCFAGKLKPRSGQPLQCCSVRPSIPHGNGHERSIAHHNNPRRTHPHGIDRTRIQRLEAEDVGQPLVHPIYPLLSAESSCGNSGDGHQLVRYHYLLAHRKRTHRRTECNNCHHYCKQRPDYSSHGSHLLKLIWLRFSYTPRKAAVNSGCRLAGGQ